MAEPMVLGLAWWEKWSLSVDWDETQWWVQITMADQQGLVEALATNHVPAVRKVKAEDFWFGVVARKSEIMGLCESS